MLKGTFRVEGAQLKGRMLGALISRRAAHVDAAFDYLLRFRLRHEFAGCITRS